MPPYFTGIENDTQQQGVAFNDIRACALNDNELTPNRGQRLLADYAEVRRMKTKLNDSAVCDCLMAKEKLLSL